MRHRREDRRSRQEIADELYVSLNTVKKHITHILEKLGAANRTAAVDPCPDAGPAPLTPGVAPTA